MNNKVFYNDYIVWKKSFIQDPNIPMENIENNLNCLKDVLQSELSNEMSTIVNYFIDAAIKNLLSNITLFKTFVDKKNAYYNTLNKYIELLLKTERLEANKLIMGEMEKGISIKEIYAYIFEPALKEIGRFWHINKITIAEEHYFTAATQFIMSQLYPKIFLPNKNGLKFLGVCMEEEIHEIGIRMVTDILELDGWNTYYLGANVPKKELISFLISQNPNVLGISVTMTFNLHKVIELIQEIRDIKELSGIKILVGGYAFNEDRYLWKQVGADLYAPNAIETSKLLAITFKNDISHEK